MRRCPAVRLVALKSLATIAISDIQKILQSVRSERSPFVYVGLCKHLKEVLTPEQLTQFTTNSPANRTLVESMWDMLKACGKDPKLRSTLLKLYKHVCLQDGLFLTAIDVGCWYTQACL